MFQLKDLEAQSGLERKPKFKLFVLNNLTLKRIEGQFQRHTAATDSFTAKARGRLFQKQRGRSKHRYGDIN